MKKLGKIISRLRLEKNMTLVQLAKKSGIDQATLSRIENEKMIGTVASHSRIAAALGINLPNLYALTSQKSKEPLETATIRKTELAKKLALIAKELNKLAKDLV